MESNVHYEELLHEERKEGLVLEEVSRGIQNLIDNSLDKGVPFHYIEELPRVDYIFGRFFTFLGRSLQLNAPIHFVILLMKIFNNRKSKKRSRVIPFIKGFFYSCFFQSTYALSLPASYGMCGLVGKRLNSSWTGYLTSLLFSFTIFIEKASKQKVMGIYLLAQWSEAVINSAKKQKKFWLFPQWERVCLMMCLGGISWAYYSIKEGESSNTVESLSNHILGNPFIHHSKDSKKDPLVLSQFKDKSQIEPGSSKDEEEGANEKGDCIESMKKKVGSMMKNMIYNNQSYMDSCLSEMNLQANIGKP